MLKWKDEYGTGVESIDEQHKKLFEIAGRAYELIKNQFIIDKYDMIVEVINELKEYTIYHFQEEEKYMIENGYKKIFTHKVVHSDLIQKLNEIDFNKIENNQDKYLLDLLNFIVNWIDEHILKNDKLAIESIS